MKPILLRSHEAARLCNISEKTWRTWNQLGKIPMPLKMGRLHFWRSDELLLWIAAGCPPRKFWNYRDLKNPQKSSTAGIPSPVKSVKVSHVERKSARPVTK